MSSQYLASIMALRLTNTLHVAGDARSYTFTTGRLSSSSRCCSRTSAGRRPSASNWRCSGCRSDRTNSVTVLCCQRGIAGEAAHDVDFSLLHAQDASFVVGHDAQLDMVEAMQTKVLDRSVCQRPCVT